MDSKWNVEDTTEITTNVSTVIGVETKIEIVVRIGDFEIEMFRQLTVQQFNHANR